MKTSKMIVIATVAVSLVLSWILIPLVGGTRAAPLASDSIQQLQRQITLSPTAIAWVESDHPNSNYGGLGHTWVGYGLGSDPDLGTTRGLARFDLSAIPVSATITDVELRATIDGGHGTEDFTYNVAKVTEGWSESSVNWNNQPDRQGPMASTSISRASGTVSWSQPDLRNLVQEWVSGTTTNNGLYLRRADDRSGPEHDRRFRDLQLVVTYEIPEQGQVTLNPAAVAFVASDYPDTNYGDLGYVWVGYGLGPDPDLGTTRGLVRFNLSSIPANAIITQAELRATVTDGQGGATTNNGYRARSVYDSWSQSHVTWNNKPRDGVTYDTSFVVATSGSVSWDITRLAQSWRDPGPNDGVYLIRQAETSEPEHDRKFSDLRLVVNYEVPAEPTRTPTPSNTIVKVDLEDPVCAGEEVEYVISGSAMLPQTGVIEIRDTIPARTTFVSASHDGTFDGDRTVTWRLMSGQTESFERHLTLRVRSDVEAGTQIRNQVEMWWGDSLLADAVEHTTVCQPSATNTITKVDLQDPVNAGEEVEYLISGSATLLATGVIEIRDTIPSAQPLYLPPTAAPSTVIGRSPGASSPTSPRSNST